MKFITTIIVVLSLGFLAVNSAFAAVISNGSSGELRPTSDFTLDLSGSTVPQFSSIFIDAGIRLTILTPTGGIPADLLAANDIFVNGIIDAGNGNLNLRAGNQIVLGVSSQIFAGSLDVVSSPLLSPRRPLPRGNQSGGLIGGDVSISPGGDVSLRSGTRTPRVVIPEPSSILLLLPGLGLLATRKSWQRKPV